jgi:hypothetical protein
MIKRILYQAVLGTIIQIALYVVILYFAKYSLDLLTDDKYILMDHYGILLSTFIFVIILFVQNILVAVIDKKWFRWLTIFIVLIFYIIAWGENFNNWPIRTIIYLISGIVVILIKVYIDTVLTNRINITIANKR